MFSQVSVILSTGRGEGARVSLVSGPFRGVGYPWYQVFLGVGYPLCQVLSRSRGAGYTPPGHCGGQYTSH